MRTELLFLALLAGVAIQGNIIPTVEINPVDTQFLKGNPELCNSRPLFSVLPGNGWDNLRNKEMDMVVEHNYSRCSTTEDAQFLLPNDVSTIASKTSDVQTTAELIDHWDNYTSTVSSSINADANLGFKGFEIGGKFSKEYSSLKEKQYNDKSVTTRTQARYMLYQARLNRGVSLNPNFKSRVKKIGFYVTLNKLDLARYESQLLVRDYGTHVITTMDVGALILKADQIKESFIEQSRETKQAITTSASTSFFGRFDFGANFAYSTKTSNADLQSYLSQVTTSDIQSIGGTMFKPINFSVNQWINSIKENMVAIDVDGDPLTYFITQEALPDIPVRTIVEVQNFVAEAIACYYKHNTYRGCTDKKSPNFNFHANLDDGTCQNPMTNFTFGGVYQTCSSSGYTNLCTNMVQKNPLTGDFTCPKGYSAVLLNSGTKSSSTLKRVCPRCHLILHCCKTWNLTSSASYSAYWCAAEGPVGMNQGFLFGGTFTSKVVNPLTQRNSCPQHFYGIKALQDLTICVSDDYEIAGRLALPFAGFFSCRTGNPFAISKGVKLLQNAETSFTLMSYIKSSGASSYPKQCPKDYSQHLVIVDSGCEINYCAKTGAFSAKGLIAVQRPPFMSFPAHETDGIDPDDFAIKGTGNEWLSTKQTAALQLSKASTISDSSEGEMSALGAGILGAVLALVVTGGVYLIVFIVRRKRTAAAARSGQPYDNVHDAAV